MNYLSSIYIKEKWQHTGFQKYFRNTGWMFVGRIFSLLVSFFMGAYIARYLGPSNFGLFNYVTSFVGLFGFIATFGIDGIVSREIIKNHELKNRIIGTSFFLKLIGAVLAIISILIVAYFTNSNSFTFLLIFLFSLNYIPQAFNVIEIYFQSQVLSKNIVYVQISATFISTLLKILVIVFGKGIFWLILIYIIETSITAILLLISYVHYGHKIKTWKFDTAIAKSLLKDSWPLMLSTVAIGLYMKIDQVIIKNMLGDEQVGIYAVAVRLSEFWYFIPGIICGSIFPAIIKAKETQHSLYIQRLKKLHLLMFFISFIIALPISIFSKQIINIIFGDMYTSAANVLSIYVWAGISVSLNLALNQFLVSENMTRTYFLSTLLGAVLNIILNLLLIPMYGINGSAIATVVSYSLMTFFVFGLTRLSYKK